MCLNNLIEKMMAGDRSALARLFTTIEQDKHAAGSLSAALHSHVGKSYCIGITGPPGAGKSTIIDSLVHLSRADGLTVGVLAVDPSSVFTGGAILGDRIRMNDHILDSGVFVRSIATRGITGGLSRVTGAAVSLFDAFGLDLVIVESVGVGQNELDIVDMVDTLAVVLVPEAGDAVQVMKAGLMEIADIVVINKAERDGADRLASVIRKELIATRTGSVWIPPVLLTNAAQKKGINELLRAVTAHRSDCADTISRRRTERRKSEFLGFLNHLIGDALQNAEAKDETLRSFIKQVELREIDPYSAALDLAGDSRFMSMLAESQK